MLSQLIERLKKTWRRRMSLSMVLAGSALLNGCAALGVDPSEQPVMVSEVIRMSNENVPAETIVNKMRDSRAVYRLNAAQLAKLHDQGVAERVLNYRPETYLNAVRREQGANFDPAGVGLQMLSQPLQTFLLACGGDIVRHVVDQPVHVGGHRPVGVPQHETKHQQDASNERAGNAERPAERHRPHEFRQAHGE